MEGASELPRSLELESWVSEVEALGAREQDLFEHVPRQGDGRPAGAPNRGRVGSVSTLADSYAMGATGLAAPVLRSKR
jgi:hypothetical protein